MVSVVINNRSQFILFKLEGLVIKNKSSLQVRDFQATQYSIVLQFKYHLLVSDISRISDDRESSVNAKPWTWTLIQGYWSISEIISMSIKYTNHTCPKNQKSHFVSFVFSWGLNFIARGPKPFIPVYSRSLISRLFSGRWCYVSFYAESWLTYWLKYSENGMNWPRLDQSC